MLRSIFILSFTLGCLSAQSQLDCSAIVKLRFDQSLSDSGPYELTLSNDQEPVQFTQDREGNPGCAVHFTGSSTNYLYFDDSEFFNFDPESSFSISLWFQGGSDDFSDLERLVSKGIDTWVFGTQGSPSQSDISVILYDCNEVVFVNAWSNLFNLCSTPFNNAIWHHIVAVYTPENYKLYIDGTLHSTFPTQDVVYSNLNPLEPLILGYEFEGSLDDVMFFDCALNANDVYELFNLPAFCSDDLVACDADFNQDGVVNSGDLIAFTPNMNCAGSCLLNDLNQDGQVNSADFILFLDLFGQQCAD